MSTRGIHDQIKDLYGIEISAQQVSKITNFVIESAKELQNRPLNPIYPFVFIDAIHYKVIDDGKMKNKSAYVVLGVNVEDFNHDGKKTIVFLHGWPGNHNLFEYKFNQLPKLGYRCISIDQRGFSKSDKPYEGYDYDRLSDDVRCVVNGLKLHDFILMGHSTGRFIAIRYMSRYKGYGVCKLALFAAAAPSLIKHKIFHMVYKKRM